jgi:hypothetical protein
LTLSVLSWLCTVSLSCRVSPEEADAAAARFDAAREVAPLGEADADSGADTSPDPSSVRECDLLAQSCPDRKACYPDNTFMGSTFCRLSGTAGALSPCMLQEECDARLLCIDANRTDFKICVEICDPTAADPGCPQRAPCVRLVNYPAGYCSP